MLSEYLERRKIFLAPIVQVFYILSTNSHFFIYIPTRFPSPKIAALLPKFEKPINTFVPKI